MHLHPSAFLVLLLATACQPQAGHKTDYAVLASDTSGRASMAHDPRYKTFASQDEALAWAKDFETYDAGQSGRPARAILPPSDQRYDRAKKIVEGIWAGYNQIYPGVLDGLNAPYTILIDDKGANAYAPYDPRIKQMPLAFFVQTGVTTNADGKALTDSQLYGLFGHELAHQVLAHIYPGVAETRSIHFQIHPGQEQLGFLQTDQVDVKKAMDAWLDQAALVGEFNSDELNGLPIMGSLAVELDSTLAKRKAETNSDSCKKYTDDSAALSTFTNQTMSHLDSSWNLDGAGKVTLSGLTNAVIGDATACMDGGITLSKDLQDSLADSPDEVGKLIADADFVAQKDTANLVTAVVNIAKAKFAKLHQLQASYDYSTIRTRTFEEEADDNSMLVTHLIGQNPKGIGDLISGILLSAQDHDACFKILGAGQVPGYGLREDPHHSDCYRIFHVNLFNRLIFANP